MVTADKLTQEQVEAYEKIESLKNTRAALEEDISIKSTRLKSLKSQVADFESRLKIAQKETTTAMEKLKDQHDSTLMKVMADIAEVQDRLTRLLEQERQIQDSIRNSENTRKQALVKVQVEQQGILDGLERQVKQRQDILHQVEKRLGEIRTFVLE